MRPELSGLPSPLTPYYEINTMSAATTTFCKQQSERSIKRTHTRKMRSKKNNIGPITVANAFFLRVNNLSPYVLSHCFLTVVKSTPSRHKNPSKSLIHGRGHFICFAPLVSLEPLCLFVCLFDLD